jgi:hypothetical protein
MAPTKLVPERRMLLHGMTSGLIGYVVVSVFFAATSALGGRSLFHIPALLGGTLFFGRGADAVIEPGAIIAFNGLHLLIFLVAGIFMAWVAKFSEDAMEGWYLAVILLMYVGAHVVVVPLLFEEPIRAQLSLWLVTVATTAATIAMGAYLWKAYPGIRTGMHERDDPDTTGGE